MGVVFTGGVEELGVDSEIGNTLGERASGFCRLGFDAGTVKDIDEETEGGESESDGVEGHGEGIGDSVRSTTPRRELGRAVAAAVNAALERDPTDTELRGTRETSKEMRRGECTCVCPWLGEHAGL
jgi:hypothetical protein